MYNPFPFVPSSESTRTLSFLLYIIPTANTYQQPSPLRRTRISYVDSTAWDGWLVWYGSIWEGVLGAWITNGLVGWMNGWTDDGRQARGARIRGKDNFLFSEPNRSKEKQGRRVRYNVTPRFEVLRD